MYLKGGENLNFAIPINDAKQLLRSDCSKVLSFPNEPERPALSAESQPKPSTHDGDASSARKRTMCITEVATNSGSQIQPVLPCQFFASLPVSLSRGDHGLNGKVCILDVMTLPNGQPEAIPPCLIVSLLPFSFSKEEVSIYEGMLNAETNGMTFMQAEDKSLIALAVKAFRDQRNLFCRRHPEMAIFNLEDSPVRGGPYFSETGPQSCTATTSTSKNGLPPNTKIAESLRDPSNATDAQVFGDTRYCYQNPNNNLQAPNGSLVACKELIAKIDVRLAQCKTGPESKTKDCKTLLKRFKDFQAGRL
jgi:hypothetical protein